MGGKQSAVWKMVNLVLSICKSSKVRSLRTSHEPLQRKFSFLELNFSSEASTLRMRQPYHLGSGGHVLVIQQLGLICKRTNDQKKRLALGTRMWQSWKLSVKNEHNLIY